MKKIVVSVCMITYNHENYISKAIEGVLMQEGNFEVELIIANDCSKDKTDLIILEILNNCKNKNISIKYFKHDKNLGMMPNFMFALKKCSGQYVALCEGDDYWIDPLKLQKQINFLNEHPDFVIHSSNAIGLTKDLEKTGKPILESNVDNVYSLKDFLSFNNIITCTVMFRNVTLQFPKSFNKVTFGDWFLYVILMQETKLKIYRSTELLSTYRIHEGGVMSNLTKLDYYNKHIFQIVSINNYLEDKENYPLEFHFLNDLFIKKFRLVLKDKMYLESLNTFLNNFRYCSFKMPFRKYISALKYNYLE